MTESSLLTVQEAADRLRLSRTSVYREMGAGRLAFVKIGKSRRILESALTEFIERLQREAIGRRQT